MCKLCVEEGLMSQEDLEQAEAAGDPTVRPMNELSLSEFVPALAAVAREAVQGGMPMAVALASAVQSTQAYLELHPEITSEDVERARTEWHLRQRRSN